MSAQACWTRGFLGLSLDTRRACAPEAETLIELPVTTAPLGAIAKLEHVLVNSKRIGPIHQSMLFDPEVIVAIGNGWWTGDTNIVPIQMASAEASAALLGLLLAMVFNH